MDETTIPWPRAAAFVRQHTHDVRNGLNSLDLEIELLNELVPVEGEAMDSVKRIRKQVRGVTQQLRTLSILFQEPSPLATQLPARVLLKIWREKHAALTPAPEVQWVDELGDQEISVDVEMMATVFKELLTNAATHSPGGPLTISARAHGADVIFELREPKQTALDPVAWGQPFVSTRRDRYGLGLFNAKRLAKASGVSLVQSYAQADGCLVTQLGFPIV